MRVKSTADVSQFMKGIKARVTNMSEEAFKSKINSIYLKIKGSVLTQSRNAVKSFLFTKQGNVYRGAKIPNIDTGNLIENIFQNKIIGTPKYTKIGDKLRATITTWYGIDTDVMGNNTVIKQDGSLAPYAEYLNTSKKFSRYNGYFQGIKENYKKSFSTNTMSLLRKEFGKNLTLTYRY